jgi:hypothetical protein
MPEALSIKALQAQHKAAGEALEVRGKGKAAARLEAE